MANKVNICITLTMNIIAVDIVAIVAAITVIQFAIIVVNTGVGIYVSFVGISAIYIISLILVIFKSFKIFQWEVWRKHFMGYDSGLKH